MATVAGPADRGERLYAALRKLAAAMARREAARAASAGVPAASLGVLEPLVDALALPAGELARRSGLSSSALSHSLARHERAGLVERERQRGDGRVVLVRLTREGRRALQPARAAHLRTVDALESELGAGELDELLDRLERVLHVLERGTPTRARPGAPA